MVEMPAEHNLRRRLAVLGGDAGKRRVGQEARAAERAPRFRLHAVKIVEGAQAPLLKARMQFDLVHRWNDAGFSDDPLEVVAVEVGDADRADLAFVLKPDHCLPAVDVAVHARPWPMDEIEVDNLAAQLLRARREGAQ